MSPFVGRSWSSLLDDAILAMTTGDAVRAKHTLDELERTAGSYEGAGARTLSSAWEPFLLLLKRRGYFVASVSEMRVSLEEIQALGAGFDLYDLAASLARCDSALAAHLRAASARLFPELAPFAAREGKT